MEPWAAVRRSARQTLADEIAELIAAGVLVDVDEPRSPVSGSPPPSEEEEAMESCSGMWAPYEPAAIGEPLELLEEAKQFVLVDASVREAVATQFGPRDAVDLVVGTTEPGVTRLVSGFAAGIVGQAKRKGDGDLPAVATIVQQQTGRGATRALQFVEKVVPGDPAAIAAAAARLPVPLRPLNAAANGSGQPAGDDEIPF